MNYYNLVIFIIIIIIIIIINNIWTCIIGENYVFVSV